MEELLHRVLEKLESLERGQQQLCNDVSSLKTDVSSLKTDVSLLKIDVSTLKVDMATLKETVDKIQTRQDGIFEETAFLTEFRFETLSILNELKENQKSMYELLGEHDIQIRSLRRRPV